MGDERHAQPEPDPAGPEVARPGEPPQRGEDDPQEGDGRDVQREGRLDRASELMYGSLPDLEKQLAEGEAAEDALMVETERSLEALQLVF